MENGMYSNLIDMYPVSKTIRMALEPIGKTAENIADILAEDEQRAEDYKKAKLIIDKVHRQYIDECMNGVKLSMLENYCDLYGKKDKSDELDNVKGKMRAEIAAAMPDPPMFNIKNYPRIINYIDNAEDKKLIEKFKKFVTYFKNYNTARKNIYTKEEISTAVGYRLINDNLPKYVNNIKIIKKALDLLSVGQINGLIEQNRLNDFAENINELTSIGFYNKVLTQSGISAYNVIIGGINGLINLHNQQCSDNGNKIGKLSALYKQILSEKVSLFFVSEQFKEDKELIDALGEVCEEIYKNTISGEKGMPIIDILKKMRDCDLSCIYVKNGPALKEISQALKSNWNYINNAINAEYDSIKKPKNITDRYIETRKKALKKVKSYSIKELNKYLGDSCAEDYFLTEAKNICGDISNNYAVFNEYSFSKNITKDAVAVEIIKKLCDSIKRLEWLMKPLIVEDIEADESFYGDFNEKWVYISTLSEVYNKVRNYMTKKPYSQEKFKLNFSRSDFLNGWGRDYGTKEPHLFEYENNFYLGIVNKSLTAEELNEIYHTNRDAIHFGYNFQKSDIKNVPRIFIRSASDRFAPNVEKHNLPVQDIIDIYDSRKFKTDYRKIDPVGYKQALIKLIDYFKLGFTRDEHYKDFELQWKASEEYNDILEFYNDVACSCYKLTKEEISFNALLKLVSEGKLFLFRIFNKDFSQHSKGMANLHTLYWNMLFDDENLICPQYKLSGEAEMFFRKKSLSIDETTVHKAGVPINNKNENGSNKQGVFAYDIIKDRRYTVDRFLLHTSIVLNFRAKGTTNINDTVNKHIKYNDDVYAIGVDRGERNLLYISVVNSKGEIVEQKGLNIIGGTDYHKLLANREDERKKARQNWKMIENISHLKEGYLSVAVHEITNLMQKYNAVLVMEDLKFRFKRSRQGFERNVYQQFEKMLINKLNYYVDKRLDKNEEGGLLKPLQLTNKFESFEKMGKQNGVIFYIPAWLTSKIDPVTGFANLFYVKYESTEKARAFFNCFDSIGYNAKGNYFEFAFDYNNFTTRADGTKTKWTLCSYGERIHTYRSKETNNEYKSVSVNLTEEFKRLFEANGIKLSADMKDAVISLEGKAFYEKLIILFKLMVQLRNSSNKDNIDYIISPVKNKDEVFFDSRCCDETLPKDADANGAYNIARKGLMYMDIIRKTEDKDLNRPKLVISNKDWLIYAQRQGK